MNFVPFNTFTPCRTQSSIERLAVHLSLVLGTMFYACSLEFLFFQADASLRYDGGSWSGL